MRVGSEEAEGRKVLEVVNVTKDGQMFWLYDFSDG